MGNWCICIQGTGAHHNDRPLLDADGIAKEFVEVLKNAGHSVHTASFTHGGAEQLTADTAVENKAK